CRALGGERTECAAQSAGTAEPERSRCLWARRTQHHGRWGRTEHERIARRKRERHLMADIEEVSAGLGPAPAGRENKVDQDRIAAAVREILIAVGEDPDREGLVETPSRVARAY